MNHRSKFKLGQPAWFMRENKATSLPVGSITIKTVADEKGRHSHTSVSYGFRIYHNQGATYHPLFKEWEEHDEKECFATKKSLLASL